MGLLDPEGESTSVLRNGKYLPVDMSRHPEISLRGPKKKKKIGLCLILNNA
jgi:hypothetical protein